MLSMLWTILLISCPINVVELFPFDCLYRAFLVIVLNYSPLINFKCISCQGHILCIILAVRDSAELKTHKTSLGISMAIPHIYISFAYFICEFCANALLTTVKQKANKYF